MTEIWTVTVAGLAVGWCTYYTCSDTWGCAVYDALPGSEEWSCARPIGYYHCRNEADHKEDGSHVPCLLYRNEEAVHLRWCLDCMCVVDQPHDGYVYHEFDCRMGSKCNCGAP